MNLTNLSSTSVSLNAPTQGTPSDDLYFLGSDTALRTKVGEKMGQTIRTTLRAGILVYGPYAVLSTGTYQLTVKGTAQNTTTGCWIDVACDLGERCLIKIDIPPASANGEWTATAEFSLEFSVKNIETRMWVPATADMALLSISIARVAPKANNVKTQMLKLPQKQNHKSKRR